MTDFKKMVSNAPQTQPIPFPSTAPLGLLRMISRNQKQKKYDAVESNFLYAAMHIACMKDLRFSVDTCPDLPDNIDALLRSYV